MQITFWEIAQVLEVQNEWKKWEDFTILTVEFDTRKVSEGSLFVPLKGQRDGHDFIQLALEKGASATLWSKRTPPEIEVPYLQVTDTLTAMQKLAQYYLKKVKPQVIAITGSNGKTTTKDMTEAVLAQRYRTHKTQGNYNNHIGLPYTILHMPEKTEMLVLEMGMDHKGEIAILSKLAEPNVVAITMVGESHIEHLGTRQGIAEAKMEIMKGLKRNGLCLIPAEEPLLQKIPLESTQKKATFGNRKTSEIFPTNIKSEKKTTEFCVNLFRTQKFHLPVTGVYNVLNACIALYIGNYYQVEAEQMARGLENLNLTQNRTEWLKAFNGAEILSDVYNSNPTALKLVLRNISQMEQEGKKIVVIGDMLDLGDQTDDMHQQMAKEIIPGQIDEVFLFGEKVSILAESLQAIYDSESLHHYHMKDRETMIKKIKETLQPEDLILLKGSNGMNLGTVVAALCAREE